MIGEAAHTNETAAHTCTRSRSSLTAPSAVVTQGTAAACTLCCRLHASTLMHSGAHTHTHTHTRTSHTHARALGAHPAAPGHTGEHTDAPRRRLLTPLAANFMKFLTAGEIQTPEKGGRWCVGSVGFIPGTAVVTCVGGGSKKRHRS